MKHRITLQADIVPSERGYLAVAVLTLDDVAVKHVCLGPVDNATAAENMLASLSKSVSAALDVVGA